MTDLDRYDVEAMIRDALRGYASSFDLAMLERELRLELLEERGARQDADASLSRVLNSRTEHLA